METRLLSIGLELPEETLVNLHGFSSVGETYGEQEQHILAGYCESLKPAISQSAL